jgi:predicted nucleic acid-binding protein
MACKMRDRRTRARPRANPTIVVDLSALIPLAWIGRLDLVPTIFTEMRTTGFIRDEVLTGGKRGTASIESFLADVPIRETRSSDLCYRLRSGEVRSGNCSQSGSQL